MTGDQLNWVRTSYLAAALDTILGPPRNSRATPKRTSVSFIRDVVHRGYTYDERDDRRGWMQHHMHQAWAMVIVRCMRDVDAPHAEIEQVLEDLEFGGRKKVVIEWSVGCVKKSYTVRQDAAMALARRVLGAANASEFGEAYADDERVNVPAHLTVQ